MNLFCNRNNTSPSIYFPAVLFKNNREKTNWRIPDGNLDLTPVFDKIDFVLIFVVIL